MTKTLEMTFKDSTGKNVMISIPNPKDGLTLAQVDTVMEDIIDKNIFVTTNGNLVDAVEAKIRVVDVTVLA